MTHVYQKWPQQWIGINLNNLKLNNQSGTRPDEEVTCWQARKILFTWCQNIWKIIMLLQQMEKKWPLHSKQSVSLAQWRTTSKQDFAATCWWTTENVTTNECQQKQTPF